MEPKHYGETGGIDERAVSKGAEGRGASHASLEELQRLGAKDPGRSLCRFKLTSFHIQLCEVTLPFKFARALTSCTPEANMSIIPQ